MRTAKILDVMVASPDDCKSDRRAVAEAISQWNHANRNSGVRFDALDGELHTYPEAGNAEAQEYVNRQLIDEADLLIALFWTRLGTPTRSSPSGTVHEIERVLDFGRPAGLFFSDRAVPPSQIDEAQVRALADFRATSGSAGLGSSYSNTDDLRAQLQSYLSAYAYRFLNEEPGDFAETLRKTQQTQSEYQPGTDTKRLEIQARHVAPLDNSAIEVAVRWIRRDRPRETIRVLDVGCANGFVTRDRFGDCTDFDVEAIDWDPRAVQQAVSENSADNIRYRAVDITNRGDLQLGTFDLVFCALTIHHMASPEAILVRLWGMLRPSGALIVRTPDDGLKLTYPDQDKGMERLISVSSALLGSSDRFHGRKAMGQLQSLLPQPVQVEMKGQVTSTAGYGSGEREDFFADHYGYRADNASKLAQSGDATAEMKAAAEQLQRAVSDMRTRFVLDDNVFSTSTDLAFVAVKGLAESTDVWSSI